MERRRTGGVFLVLLLSCSLLAVQGETPNNLSEQNNPEPICNANRENWTVGLVYCNDDSQTGYTLFSPFRSSTAFLIDQEGREINTWQSPGGFSPGAAAYLLEDGSLLRTGNMGNESVGNFTGGGIGGKLERIGWDGVLEWSWEYSSYDAILHHDIEPMPNGNILAIAWEDKTEQEALEAGRNPAIASDGPSGQNNVWPDHIIEIQPVGTNQANIVWEWHAWDHLIQDYDPTKENFGSVEDHPELLNLNYVAQTGNQAGRADWMHCNGIDYNEPLDQILLSCRGMDEIYIIDHSTTTQEAAGHTGGTSGKGGDFLYRWGNPQVYKKGLSSNQQLFGQHDAQWVVDGHPEAGKLMVFNNGIGRDTPYSSVDIIDTGIVNGAYPLLPNGTFSPAHPTWSWNKEGMYASIVSGAQSLSNGNILVSIGTVGALHEVTTAGELAWTYINPIANNVSHPQSQSLLPGNIAGTTNNMMFKSYRYEVNFSGFIGKDMSPGAYLEQWEDSCPQESAWKWDTNGDGCIDDSDDDGVLDPYDQCLSGDDGIDADQDSTPDACDSFVDSDSDGIEDSADICPGHTDSIDEDNDSIPDGCDDLIDSDFDGFADELDQCPGYDDGNDSDGDGLADGCDDTPLFTGQEFENEGKNSTNGINDTNDDEILVDAESSESNDRGISTTAWLGYFLMLIGLWLSIYLAIVATGDKNSHQTDLTFHDEPSPNQVDAKHIPVLDLPANQYSSNPPVLPATGLPDGWTMEQWNYYGNQWLEQNNQRP